MEAGTSTIVDRGYAGLPIPFGWYALNRLQKLQAI